MGWALENVAPASGYCVILAIYTWICDSKDANGKSAPKIVSQMVVNWLVVSTHLKNISQIGNLPQIGVKIKNI